MKCQETVKKEGIQKTIVVWMLTEEESTVKCSKMSFECFSKKSSLPPRKTVCVCGCVCVCVCVGGSWNRNQTEVGCATGDGKKREPWYRQLF